MARDSGRRKLRVRSFDELAKKYGFSVPTEWVGPESSRSMLDYGPPIVLADSARKSDETARDEMWERLLRRVAEKTQD